MAIIGKVNYLLNSKQEIVYPRTVTSAISISNEQKTLEEIIKELRDNGSAKALLNGLMDGSVVPVKANNTNMIDNIKSESFARVDIDVVSPGKFHTGDVKPTSFSTLNYNGTLNATGFGVSYGSDIAIYRSLTGSGTPGQVVSEGPIRDNEDVEATTSRLQGAVVGVITDTPAFRIQYIPVDATHVAVAIAGRVLVSVEGVVANMARGDALCATANGKASVMTQDEIKNHPEKIIGYISSFPSTPTITYGDTTIQVNNRIWMNIK